MPKRKQEWLESGERGEIERNFGAGKRRCSLGCIVTKLRHTSEVAVRVVVLTMNLRKMLRLLLHLLYPETCCAGTVIFLRRRCFCI